MNCCLNVHFQGQRVNVWLVVFCILYYVVSGWLPVFQSNLFSSSSGQKMEATGSCEIIILNLKSSIVIIFVIHKRGTGQPQSAIKPCFLANFMTFYQVFIPDFCY